MTPSRHALSHALDRPWPILPRWSVVTLALLTIAGLVVAVSVGRGNADAAPLTIFGGSVPANQSDPDGQAVEVGVRFSSAEPGALLGVRFYKGPGNVGTHTGTLWTTKGKALAKTSFTNETASGWQQATFATPIAIAAGVVYIASYHTSTGHYADDQQSLSPTRPARSGSLLATAGVYRYGQTSAFPNRTWQGSNYYVDVLFQPTPGTAISTPPTTSLAAGPGPSLSATHEASGSPSSTSSSSPTTVASSTPSPTTSPPNVSTSLTSTASPTSQHVTTPPTPSLMATPIASTSTASSVKGCAVKPSACGYPDATNTGVPAGTVLRSVPGQVSSGPGWHWDSRGWLEVDGDGAVLDGLDIRANLDITASNVTVKNSRISETGDSFGISLRHTSKVTIQDSEITGPSTGSTRLMVGIKDIYGDSTGTQILRNDIARTSTGVQMESGLIQDNYIHDMGYKSGDHLNGITSNGSTALLTIRHNTVLNSFDQTDAISLFEDFGVQANRTIDNNLVAGGGYTIYGGANPGGAATSNIHITNNRFSRLYYPNGGSYGPVTAYAPSGAGNTWTGNIWDDTLTPVNP